MSLRCLGLCGVDDSIDPALLSTIVRNWSDVVELGVLFRPGLEGKPLYPTREWCIRFAAEARKIPLKLAAHLCGTAVDKVLSDGDVTFVKETLVPWGFRRVQLNATKRNGCKTSLEDEITVKNVFKACKLVPEVEFIVQANDETEPLWRALITSEDNSPTNLSLLWDASCGTGKIIDVNAVAKKSVDAANAGLPFGFAGGLNPSTIAETLLELRKLTVVKSVESIWLDMESGLRSVVNEKNSFDIHKAWAVLSAIDTKAGGWKWKGEVENLLMSKQDSVAGNRSNHLLSTALPSTAKVSGHPVLAHKVTLLRDRRTKPREFRSILRETAFYLGYEAMSALLTSPRRDCVSPAGVLVKQGQRLATRVALIPIMRAGLGMLDPMLDIMPDAAVHQIGMYKRGLKSSDRPIEYYSRLPRNGGGQCDLAIVLDPVIATSRTVHAVITKLKVWGARKIIVIGVLASKEGLIALQKSHSNVNVYVAQVDDELTQEGEMIPGLGDPGDRLYGAPNNWAYKEEEDVAPFLKHIHEDEEGRINVEEPTTVSTVSTISSGADEDENENANNNVNEKHARESMEESREKSETERRINPPAVVDLDAPSTMVLGDINVDNVDDFTIPPPLPTLGADDSATQLTTHNGSFGTEPVKLQWGAETAYTRGPVLATTRHTLNRNAIGAHAGGYSIYRALAAASGNLDSTAFPKLGLTTPAARIGPHLSWTNKNSIVTMDPWGHAISEAFGAWLRKGYDIRPTIAITRAHIELPECKEALRLGRLQPDGDILAKSGTSLVTKAAIEPVWYLPGVADRFGVDEQTLRDALFEETNSMYPELITRPDLKVFLPPCGGMTVYIWGDPAKMSDPSVPLTCRVHDECNGSDVFGSDICTCRPYLTHAIEECIKGTQQGGVGVCVYFRKEGRALGEVTKYLVYNMRKRQEGGDQAAEYFNCTQSVAGVTDTRFQALMPDVLHWLGIKKIHRFISMSDMKYNAITQSGIEIIERVEIPPELVPADAQVEITAKVHHGYHGGKSYFDVDEKKLKETKGREYFSADKDYFPNEKDITQPGLGWSNGDIKPNMLPIVRNDKVDLLPQKQK